MYQWPDAAWPNATWVPPSSVWPDPAVPSPKPTGWPQRTPDIRVQVWAKPLHGGDVGVVAFNRGPGPATVNLTWPMLGLPAGATASVRDLWKHADLGRFAGAVSASVGSHDVFAARVTPHTQPVAGV